MIQKNLFVVRGFIVVILKLSILAVITLLFSNIVSAATNISACGTISSSGYYVLNQSITASGTCLIINTGNVELDCKGYNITYATGGGNGLIGIDATSAAATLNLTIKNCIIGDYNSGGTTGYGIRFQRYSNSTIFNNTINTNGSANNYGIYILTNSQNNTIKSNTIYSSGSTTGNSGVVISGTAALNSDYNSVISNTIRTLGTTGNHGIYLFNNVSHTTVSGNDIIASGTNTNYGIYISGAALATPSNNNYIFNNSVQTYGSTAGNDYGIYLQNVVSSNNILNNTITTHGTTANYGVYLLGTAAFSPAYNVVDSNIIQTQGSTNVNYGISLSTNADYNNITNNIINTTGTTGNDGIVVAGIATAACTYNFISGNTIRTYGSLASNYGIYLLTNSSFNNVSNNNIVTNGTTTNHGIYLAGAALATATNNNTVFNNSIQTFGTAGVVTGYGIYLQSEASSNNILNNTITTHGTTTNYGVYLLGTAALSPNYNVVDSNIIQVQGSNTNNYGIYLLTNSGFNNVSNNIITTNGTTGNDGVVISGTTAACNYNFIFGNTVRTYGSGAGNYGIYLLTNSSFNNVSTNNIIANGTTTAYGIYLSGTAVATPVNNNDIYNNSIQTKCSTAGSTCHGIYIQSAATNTSIIRNIITTGGTTTNNGIYLLGSAVLPLNLTLISLNILNVSKADRINIATGVSNVTLNNNSIINRDYSYYDIKISAAGVNGTSFIDQYLENYTFTGAGGFITIKNSNFGQIVFQNPVNGSGTNFSKDISIAFNYIYVNSSQIGLNKSANLTLYNLPFTTPRILRDGIACGSECTILDYTSGKLLFNVTHFSNYSANETPNSPIIQLISITDSLPPENEITLSAGTIRPVNCTGIVTDLLNASNIIGANATLYYSLNSSSASDNNLVHYTNTSCDLTQFNFTHDSFSCGFNVWYYANNGTWNCSIAVFNNQSASAFASNNTIIDPLYAVNITDGVEFANAQSGFISNNVTVNITNFGNMPVNVTLQGYALAIGDNIGMNCSDNTNITISNIRFSINASDNFNQKTQMSGAIQSLNLKIAKQINSTQIFNSTYWQITPDPGSKNRVCGGYVIFSAEAS